MAARAVLAEIALRGQDRFHRSQIGRLPGVLLNTQDLPLVGQHLLLQFIECRRKAAAIAKLADHGRAANDHQVLDDRKFLDLVEEDFALSHRAGNHHAGQTGHRHFVDAVGEVPGLRKDGLAIDASFPGDHAAERQCEHQPDRYRQP